MKKAIFTSPYIPSEFIAAHDIEPIRIFPRLEKAERPGFSKVGMCPYAAAFIGEAFSAGDDTIVLFATTCDQMRRAVDLTWHGHPVCPSVFLLNIPATWQTPSSFKLYLGELKRLSSFLQSQGGNKPSKDKLIETMTEYDKERQSLLAQKHLFKALQYAEFMKFQKNVFVNPDSSIVSSGIPVALIGGPLLNDDLYLFDLIEDAGGRVALNAMENGERTFPRKFDRRSMNEDPVIELADAYFGSIPDAFRRPNNALYVWLKERLEQEQIKGVIFHHYIWCDIWHAELARFKEWTNLPVLNIHAGDDGETVRGKMRDLIQTFMQVLR